MRLSVRHVAISALVSLHLLALWLSSSLLGGHQPPDPRLLIFLTLLISQIGLLGIWTALGTTPWFLRFPLAFVAAYCLWLVASRETDEPVGVVFSVAVPLIVIPLWALRIWRIRLVRDATPTQAVNRSASQFSLQQVMLLVAGLAALLGAGRMLTGSGPAVARLVTISVVVSIPGALVWATLGNGSAALRLLLIVGVAACVGIVHPVVHGMTWEYVSGWVVMSTFTVLLSGASLIVLRWLGYRVISHNTGESQPMPNLA